MTFKFKRFSLKNSALILILSALCVSCGSSMTEQENQAYQALKGTWVFSHFHIKNSKMDKNLYTAEECAKWHKDLWTKKRIAEEIANLPQEQRTQLRMQFGPNWETQIESLLENTMQAQIRANIPHSVEAEAVDGFYKLSRITLVFDTQTFSIKRTDSRNPLPFLIKYHDKSSVSLSDLNGQQLDLPYRIINGELHTVITVGLTETQKTQVKETMGEFPMVFRKN